MLTLGLLEALLALETLFLALLPAEAPGFLSLDSLLLFQRGGNVAVDTLSLCSTAVTVGLVVGDRLVELLQVIPGQDRKIEVRFRVFRLKFEYFFVLLLGLIVARAPR